MEQDYPVESEAGQWKGTRLEIVLDRAERERERESRIFASLVEECRFRGSMKTYQPFHDTRAPTFIVRQTRYLIVGGGGTPRVIDSFDPGLRPDLP